MPRRITRSRCRNRNRRRPIWSARRPRSPKRRRLSNSSRPRFRIAEENLRNATIVSPIDGVVLSRDSEVGDAVSSILLVGSSATLIMTVGDLNEVYVKGKVDESDIGKVYLGQPARITVESFKDQKFDGPRDQDLAHGRRKRQRHHVRSSRLDLQRKAHPQSADDGQRRDHSGRAQGRAGDSGRRGDLQQGQIDRGADSRSHQREGLAQGRHHDGHQQRRQDRSRSKA